MPDREEPPEYACPSAPGRTYFRLAELAIERGVVKHGPHKGEPNLVAIVHGTSLAYSTVVTAVVTAQVARPVALSGDGLAMEQSRSKAF